MNPDIRPPLGDGDRRQPVVLAAEVLHTIEFRQSAEPAGEVVRPPVVVAAELRGRPALLGADAGRPVPADVDERPQRVVFSAHSDYRFAADVGGEELPGARHQFPPADRLPRAGEHGFALGLVHLGRGVPRVRDRTRPFERQFRVEPGEQALESTFRHGDTLQAVNTAPSRSRLVNLYEPRPRGSGNCAQIVTDEKPPSTTMFWPVTNDDARGAASHTTAPASSCASPNRPIGVCPTIAWPRSVYVPSSLSSIRRFCSAGKKPGVIAFTRTPFVAHSRASHCVRFSTAALEAEYATTRESGRIDEIDAMLMMLPLPAATIVSPNTWHGSSAPPMRFRSKTPCQPSSGSLQKSPPGATVPSGLFPPAPFTSTLTDPHCLMTASRAFAIESLLIASADWNIAFPPAFSMARTRSSPR